MTVARSEGVGRIKKLKGLRSTNWLLKNSHGDVQYSIGNIVNNILITMYGVRWIWNLWGWSLSKLHNIQPLRCTPDTNIILYATYNWKIKMIKKEIKKMFSLKLLALQHLTDLQHSLIWNFPSIPFTILPWFPLSAWTSSVSYTHLTLPTILGLCRSRWSPYH